MTKGKISYETRTLIKYLQECSSLGKDATFEEMSRLLNGSVQYKFRTNLSSAIKILRRDYRLLFESVYCVGYRPLLKGVAKSVTSKRQKRIRAETVCWKNELNTVNPGNLGKKEFKDYLTACLKLGVQEFIGSKEVNERLELQGQQNKTRSTGLEYAKHALRELIDVV